VQEAGVFDTARPVLENTPTDPMSCIEAVLTAPASD